MFILVAKILQETVVAVPLPWQVQVVRNIMVAVVSPLHPFQQRMNQHPDSVQVQSLGCSWLTVGAVPEFQSVVNLFQVVPGGSVLTW